MSGQHCKPNPVLLSGIQAYTRRYEEAKAKGDVSEAVQSLVSAGTIASRVYHSPNVSKSYFSEAYEISGAEAKSHSSQGRYAEAADRYLWLTSFASEKLGKDKASEAAKLANEQYSMAAEKKLCEIKSHFFTADSQSNIKRDILNVTMMLRTGAAIGKAHGMPADITDSQLVIAHKLCMDQGDRLGALASASRMSKRMRRTKLMEVIEQMRHHTRGNTTEENALPAAFESLQNRYMRNVYCREIAAESFMRFANAVHDAGVKRMFKGMAIGCLAEAANDRESTGIRGRIKQAAEDHYKIAMLYESMNDKRAGQHFMKEKELMERYEAMMEAHRKEQVIEVS
ncbi:MAG: hypothetical protein KGH58_00785 [Candidatus Micrarchaeota archaeon]|nr:hypothetical protein [Candidatus Micrarchaeota archaeon]